MSPLTLPCRSIASPSTPPVLRLSLPQRNLASWLQKQSCKFNAFPRMAELGRARSKVSGTPCPSPQPSPAHRLVITGCLLLLPISPTPISTCWNFPGVHILSRQPLATIPTHAPAYTHTQAGMHTNMHIHMEAHASINTLTYACPACRQTYTYAGILTHTCRHMQHTCTHNTHAGRYTQRACGQIYTRCMWADTHNMHAGSTRTLPAHTRPAHLEGLLDVHQQRVDVLQVLPGRVAFKQHLLHGPGGAETHPDPQVAQLLLAHPGPLLWGRRNH